MTAIRLAHSATTLPCSSRTVSDWLLPKGVGPLDYSSGPMNEREMGSNEPSQRKDDAAHPCQHGAMH
jgi:hypothetical protein